MAADSQQQAGTDTARGTTKLIRETEGAFHYAKDSGNFGRNSNGKVRFGFFRPEYSGATRGAFHYAKDSGNFGRNSNGKVRFGFFRPEYSGSPLEVVHLFRLEYSDRSSPFHFLQTGSLP